MNDTTPSPDSGDITTTSDDWQSRYVGLQKVVAKRDTELTTTQAELEQLRKEREQAQAELDTYRQRDVDASEEEQARQQYEALRTRFEEGPPKPVGNNAQRPAKGWEDGSDTSWTTRGHNGNGSGFPI